MNHSRAAIESDFSRILSRQLARDAGSLPGDTALTALGMDFLALLELTVAVEDHFGVRLSSRGFSAAFTLDVCVNLLERTIVEHGNGVPEPVVAEGAD